MSDLRQIRLSMRGAARSRSRVGRSDHEEPDWQGDSTVDVAVGSDELVEAATRGVLYVLGLCREERAGSDGGRQPPVPECLCARVGLEERDWFDRLQRK